MNGRFSVGRRFAASCALSLAPWFPVASCLVAPSAVAQVGTVTDDGFISNNAVTQSVNLNGQGGALVVAGSKATVGSAPVGATSTYVKFQLQSSLPAGISATTVVKATLKLYLSPLTNPSGSLDIYKNRNRTFLRLEFQAWLLLNGVEQSYRTT